MAESHLESSVARALDLAAQVDRYEGTLCQLVRHWREDPRADMAKYEVVSEQVDHIRNRCATLPGLALIWVNLLISHTDLMCTLWMVAQGAKERSVLERQLQEHCAVIREFRKKCRDSCVRR